MKIQIDKGNGNTQVSNDPNSIQIQIGNGPIIFIAIMVAIIVCWILL